MLRDLPKERDAARIDYLASSIPTARQRSFLSNLTNCIDLTVRRRGEGGEALLRETRARSAYGFVLSSSADSRKIGVSVSVYFSMLLWVQRVN